MEEEEVFEIESAMTPKEQAALLEEEIKERDDRIEELQASIRKIQEDREAKKLARRALYWAIREQERLEAEARRREEEEAAARIHAALLREKSLHFDETTKDKRWRGRAFEHQIEGAKHLAVAARGILADQPGLGKTLTGAGCWLDMLEDEVTKEKAQKTLIIGPGDVSVNFVNEINLYTDRPIFDISNKPKSFQQFTLSTIKLLDRCIVFLNYEAWYRNLALLDWILDARFDSLIVDEAHRIKEMDKLPYRGVSKIVQEINACPICHGPIHIHGDRWDCDDEKCGWDSWTTEIPQYKWNSIRYLLLMTGTPIPNRPTEMFPLLHLVNPELFARAYKFEQDYCKREGNFVMWKSPAIRDSFAQKLSAFYLRRTFESTGIKLPPQDIIYHDIEFIKELYPKQADLMMKLRKFNQMEIEKDRTLTIWQKIVLLLRERQAACWPGGIIMKEYVRNEDGSLKLDYLNKYKNGEPRPVTRDIHVGDLYQESMKMDKAMEIIEECIENNVRWVMFSQFEAALKEAKRRCDELDKTADPTVPRTIPTAELFTGSTPNWKADLLKANFNRELRERSGDEKMCMGLLAHYTKGGVGLNLTDATTVIILDEPWNPATSDQALARVNRMGQTENTTVHVLRLHSPGLTYVDRYMSNLIRMKRDIIEGFDNETENNSAAALSMQRELTMLLETGGVGMGDGEAPAA